MSQAVKDGDTIRALIRSVGTNQDGHTNGGITQPSKDQQAQLIAETYRKAGLDKGKTRFFEAHGRVTICVHRRIPLADFRKAPVQR